jgi:hypothetical protein
MVSALNQFKSSICQIVVNCRCRYSNRDCDAIDVLQVRFRAAARLLLGYGATTLCVKISWKVRVIVSASGFRFSVSFAVSAARQDAVANSDGEGSKPHTAHNTYTSTWFLSYLYSQEQEKRA